VVVVVVVVIVVVVVEEITVDEVSSNIKEVVTSSVDVLKVEVSVVNTNFGCIILGCFGVILLLTFFGVVFLANTMIPPGTSVTVTMDSFVEDTDTDDDSDIDATIEVDKEDVVDGVVVVEVMDDVVDGVVVLTVVVLAVVLVVKVVVVIDFTLAVVGREAETVLVRRGGVIRMEGRLLVDICVVSPFE